MNKRPKLKPPRKVIYDGVNGWIALALFLVPVVWIIAIICMISLGRE